MYIMIVYLTNIMIKNIITIIKYIFFVFHFSFILFVFFGIYFYYEVLYLQILTILSWQLNKNKCILSQFEDFFFNETITDIYFKIISNKKKQKKFLVPRYQRYTLYGYFIFCTLLYFYHNLIIYIYLHINFSNYYYYYK